MGVGAETRVDDFYFRSEHDEANPCSTKIKNFRTMTAMTAIVTCGNTRPALAAARSLGRANIPVAVAAPFRPALAMWSRYATATFLVPDVASQGRCFANSVAKELAGRYASCVLTSTDDALWALSRWRDQLTQSAQRILPPHWSVARALDRSALYDLAKSVGVPCVDMLRFDADDSPEKVKHEAKKLGLPLLVRPLVPWIEREDGSRRVIENRIVTRDEELSALLDVESELTRGGYLLEHRPSHRSLAYAAVCQDGEPVAELCQERLHEFQPFSDIATWARVIAIEPEVQRLARRLLGALSWQGPAKVEMIQLENGELRVVTVIGRLWGSIQLAIHAGVDVPLLCYKLANGYAPKKEIIRGRPGVEMRWMLGDIKDWATSVGKHIARRGRVEKYVDVLQWNDPMPFLYELQQATRPSIKLN